MSIPISQTKDLSGLQAHYLRYDSSGGQPEGVITASPQANTPTLQQNLQTQEYLLPEIENKEVNRWISVLELEQYSSEVDYAQQLEEIRQEAVEASALDSEIDPVPDAAYDDARSLLEMLSHYNVPLPDISWAEDGSLGFEWRPENGIATMGVYGDTHVIYGAFFHDKRQVEGICALSDTAMLRGFLMLLNLLF